MSVSPDSTLITDIADNTCPTHLHIQLHNDERRWIEPIRSLEDYFIALEKAFHTNHTVQSLSLNLYYEDIPYVGPKLAALILILLKTCPNIIYLKLQRCGLGSDFGCQLAAVLAQHQTLYTLNLDDNNLTDTAGIALAESLKSNTSLHHLDLDYNQLSDITAIAMVNALQSNTTLQRLDFGYPEMDSRALQLRRIPSNGYNTITSTGANAFLTLLNTHHTLQSIHFNSDVPAELYIMIREKMAEKLRAALHKTLDQYLTQDPIQLIFSFTTSIYRSTGQQILITQMEHMNTSETTETPEGLETAHTPKKRKIKE